MSTPVLTKRQQKQSLSAKKGPIKGLRNVLAQPCDTYWPVVNNEDEAKLNSLLQKLLPAAKRPISQKARKKKSKEGTESKEEAINSEEPLPNKDILNSIVFGINIVTRSLERNVASCVLLDSNVEPQLLVKHIIMMAQTKKVPVLLLPSLRVLTLENVGFSSSAFALKNTVLSLDHHFNVLYENVSHIFKNYLPPSRSLQLFPSDETFDCTISKDDSKEHDNTCNKNTLNVNEELTPTTNIYKYRSTCNERTFIPPNAVQSSNVQKKEETDFIPFNSMDCSDDEGNNAKNLSKTRYFNPNPNKDDKLKNKSNKKNKKSNNTTPKNTKNFEKGNNLEYLPLKIKRLQGNSNRVKATKVSKKKRKNLRK